MLITGRGGVRPPFEEDAEDGPFLVVALKEP
jgi:hypothetical protein